MLKPVNTTAQFFSFSRIEGKRVLFLHKQQELRELYLKRKVKEQRLLALMRRLKAVRNLKKENEDYVTETVKWRGTEYTYGELSSEFDLDNFYYQNMIRVETDLCASVCNRVRQERPGARAP